MESVCVDTNKYILQKMLTQRNFVGVGYETRSPKMSSPITLRSLEQELLM